MNRVLVNVFQSVLPNIVKHISKRVVYARADRNAVWPEIIMPINYRQICTYQTATKTKRCHRNRPSQFFWVPKIRTCSIKNNQSRWAQHDHQSHKFRCANRLKAIRSALACAMEIVLADGLRYSVKKWIPMHIVRTIWAAVNQKVVAMYQRQLQDRYDLRFYDFILQDFLIEYFHFESTDSSTEMPWLLFVECFSRILWKSSRCHAIHVEL